MKPILFRKTSILFILSVISLAIDCKFPYQPEPFVMPSLPPDRYLFPSKTDITAFVGTSSVKLTFTLKDNGPSSVYFYDYSASDPSMSRLKRSSDMGASNEDSPLISPDGSFVTYYLAQGVNSAGAYIQRLDTNAAPVLIDAKGAEPHWWKDNADNLYVIYSDAVLLPSLTIGAGKTYRQKVSLAGNGSVVGTPEEIAPYPLNGGLSHDGTTLCTGYIYAAFFDVPSQTLTPINSGYQVCNPSITPDPTRSDLMMFLNFKGPQNLNNPFKDSADYPRISGDTIAEHTVLFIVDKTNTVRDFVPLSLMDSHYQEWQTPEWSNQPGFAAAEAVISESETDGVIIKNIGSRAIPKENLVFTLGAGKLDYRSTPSVWIGN